MPLCKFVNATEVPYGEGRVAVRCTWIPKSSNVFTACGTNESMTVAKFPNDDAEADALMEYLNSGKAADQYIMIYRVEVRPFNRVYSESSKYAGQIIATPDGTPRVYTTIGVACCSRLNKDGFEEPINLSAVEGQAFKNRAYHIEQGNYLEIDGDDYSDEAKDPVASSVYDAAPAPAPAPLTREQARAQQGRR